MPWEPSEVKFAVVCYNFWQTDDRLLSLNIGETVHILEEYAELPGTQPEWYRGRCMYKRAKMGVFPAAYVQAKECVLENPGANESIIPVEDSTVKEVTYVLREWAALWRKRFLKRRLDIFTVMQTVMQDLIAFRRQLISGAPTQEQIEDLKQKIVHKIDWGNGKLNLELVPRINSEQVDGDKISAVQLYEVHKESSERLRSSSSVPSLRRSQTGDHINHIVLDVKALVCHAAGESSEAYFLLVDGRTGKAISERYVVKFDRNGSPYDMDKQHECRAVFTDLGSADLTRDIYLVAHVYRKGRMLLKDENAKKQCAKHYKRPYGYTALSLQSVIQSTRGKKSRDFDNEFEYNMRIQSCVESEFPHSYDFAIKKFLKASTTATTSSSIGVIVTCQLLEGDLQQVMLDKPLLFSRGIATVRKLGFADVIKPGDVRNDMYVTLLNGEYEKGSKKSARNVMVVMTVFSTNKEIIKDSIIGGCGEAALTDYMSGVFYHNNSPKWCETVNVALMMEDFRGAHVRFEFVHCSTRDRSNKLFAFSFIKLTSKDGLTIQDGTHDLCVYKCDDTRRLQKISYLNLASEMDDLGNPAQMARESARPAFTISREQFSVNTKLCSSKFTQNADLLKLLRWKHHATVLEDILEAFMKLPGEEIIQFLEDILEIIFEIFMTGFHEPKKCHTLLFKTLVHLLSMLKHDKFINFLPVLDRYIAEQFCTSLVYKDLLTCLKQKLHFSINNMEEEKHKNFLIKELFLVLEYVFKFIVKSRELTERTCPLKKGDNFLADIHEVFQLVGQLLSLQQNHFFEAQEAFLLCFSKSYDSLLTVMSAVEIADILGKLFSHLPKELSGLLRDAKLILLKDTVMSNISKSPDCRRKLLPLCVSQLKKCFIEKTALNGSVQVLCKLLHALHVIKQSGSSIDKELYVLLTAMFDISLQTAIQVPDSQIRTVKQPLVACIVEMLRQMEDRHYNLILSSHHERLPLKQFLLHVLNTFHELIMPKVFPKDWFVMKMITNNSILTATQYFAQALTEHFLKDDHFDLSVWRSYFELAVAFVTQPSLQLEKLSDAKRHSIKDRYQDMRVLLGYQIQALWRELGTRKCHFIPSLIGPFLEVTLIPETELRKTTIPIFYDMMEDENRRKGHYKDVEDEMIRRLDYLVTNNHGDHDYKNLFESLLLNKIQADVTLKENGTNFIRSITTLLEKLLDYRQVISEENHDKRMHCTFNILNFYKADANRTELYIRYVNKLCDLHVTSGNYVEAGFTLLLHAQLLSWDDNVLQAELRYPVQREWERKEILYREIIEYFDKGKAWEYSVPLCKELSKLYEAKLYAYKKLSEILKKEAQFFLNILDGPVLRQPPSYYSIAYYGKNFPPFVRNKQFVYRGDECQRLGTLMHQLQTEFPMAVILSSSSPTEENIKNSEAQHILIHTVKPVPDNRPEISDIQVPSEIRNFYAVNEVDTFQLDNPYHRGEKVKDNEFKTLCIERDILHTEYKLPGILRSFEVVSSNTIHLCPIEVAIEGMNDVNKNTKELMELCQESSESNFSRLSMRLSGSISANVSGGLPMYQRAFLTPDYARQHPSEAHHVSALQTAIKEQVKLLDAALRLHGRLAPVSLLPLQKSLEEVFAKLSKSVLECDSLNSSTSFLGSSPGSSRRTSTMSICSHHSVQSLDSAITEGSNRSSVVSDNLINFGLDDEIYETPKEMIKLSPEPPKKPFIPLPSDVHFGVSTAPDTKRHTVHVKSSAADQLNASLNSQRSINSSEPNLANAGSQSPTVSFKGGILNSVSATNLNSQPYVQPYVHRSSSAKQLGSPNLKRSKSDKSDTPPRPPARKQAGSVMNGQGPPVVPRRQTINSQAPSNVSPTTTATGASPEARIALPIVQERVASENRDAPPLPPKAPTVFRNTYLSSSASPMGWKSPPETPAKRPDLPPRVPQSPGSLSKPTDTNTPLISLNEDSSENTQQNN